MNLWNNTDPLFRAHIAHEKSWNGNKNPQGRLLSDLTLKRINIYVVELAFKSISCNCKFFVPVGNCVCTYSCVARSLYILSCRRQERKRKGKNKTHQRVWKNSLSAVVRIGRKTCPWPWTYRGPRSSMSSPCVLVEAKRVEYVENAGAPVVHEVLIRQSFLPSSIHVHIRTFSSLLLLLSCPRRSCFLLSCFVFFLSASLCSMILYRGTYVSHETVFQLFIVLDPRAREKQETKKNTHILSLFILALFCTLSFTPFVYILNLSDAWQLGKSVCVSVYMETQYREAITLSLNNIEWNHRKMYYPSRPGST